jgi:hypothetical protein
MTSTRTRKQKIEAAISYMIVEQGFRSAMSDLLPAVQHLCAVSLADPDNRAKEREYMVWSNAVKSACARQTDSTVFDELIGSSDAMHAHGMGISLA